MNVLHLVFIKLQLRGYFFLGEGGGLTGLSEDDMAIYLCTLDSIFFSFKREIFQKANLLHIGYIFFRVSDTNLLKVKVNSYRLV